MELNQGNLVIYIVEDYEQMSKKGAEVITALVKEKPNAILGLATGSTPVGLYKELIAQYKAGDIDFSKITTFNLDEYYPIAKNNDQSYDYFMRENLFNHVNIDPAKINLPNGEAADVAKECAEYDARMLSSGGIDLQLLGVGLNGHIGFNEPAEKLSAGTGVVMLTESTINANARFFENRDDVPKKALSMGIRSIMMAKKILLMANGEKKAEVLKDALTGKITTMNPASLLQLHRDVVVVLDKEAGQYFL
ncbi:MAG: glucosamine-6-phosphate deaminase [Clostridiales bacterium]|jgi:glucosamine-6-phosphate deaminase|nr:glucosamine-6-phosphate deaminase [Clostridiales bacterium]